MIFTLPFDLYAKGLEGIDERPAEEKIEHLGIDAARFNGQCSDMEIIPNHLCQFFGSRPVLTTV